MSENTIYIVLEYLFKILQGESLKPQKVTKGREKGKGNYKKRDGIIGTPIFRISYLISRGFLFPFYFHHLLE